MVRTLIFALALALGVSLRAGDAWAEGDAAPDASTEPSATPNAADLDAGPTPDSEAEAEPDATEAEDAPPRDASAEGAPPPLSGSAQTETSVATQGGEAAPSGEANTASAKKPSLIVPQIAAPRGIEESILNLLGELLLTEFERAGKYEVIGASDIVALLTLEQQRSLVGCDEASCLAEVAGALGGDFLLQASVGRLGSQYLLNIKIIDSRKVVTVGRWSEEVPAEEDQLTNAIRRGVATLCGTPMPEPIGPALRVSAAPPPPPPFLAGPRRWIALGATAVLAGAGATVLMRTRSEADIRKDEYAAYRDAENPVEANARYQDVEKAVKARNRSLAAGGSLLGLAVLGGAITTYFFSTGPGTPVAYPVASSGAAALVVQGAF